MAVEKAVDVVLLSSWDSPFAQRVRMALAEKDIPYQLVEANRPDHEKTPVLFHDGKPVYGSLNIVEYIEEAFPGTFSLLPSDPYARARARFWADYIDNELVDCGSQLWNLHGDPLKHAGEEMVKIFKTVEAELGEKDFFGGEHGFGFVDVAFAPFTASFLSYERYGGFKLAEVAPKVKAWQERVEATESVIKSWL